MRFLIQKRIHIFSPILIGYAKDTGNMDHVRSELYIVKDTLQQDITTASNRVKSDRCTYFQN